MKKCFILICLAAQLAALKDKKKQKKKRKREDDDGSSRSRSSRSPRGGSNLLLPRAGERAASRAAPDTAALAVWKHFIEAGGSRAPAPALH